MSPLTREIQHPAVIQLPLPAKGLPTSVFDALERRRTTREISPTPLPLQELSSLLWAACGVNRKLGPFGLPGRTAASASNAQEIDLYVALESGVYLYDAVNRLLLPVVPDDLRGGALTPGQRGVEAKAPVQLIYVVDIDRFIHAKGFPERGLQDPDIQMSYYYVRGGCGSQDRFLDELSGSASLVDYLSFCLFVNSFPHTAQSDAKRQKLR